MNGFPRALLSFQEPLSVPSRLIRKHKDNYENINADESPLLKISLYRYFDHERSPLSINCLVSAQHILPFVCLFPEAKLA